MTPEQYHQVLIGIDRSLFVLHESVKDFTDGDLELAYELQLLRSMVLKAESGHPFPFKSIEAAKLEDELEITQVPWSRNS